MLLETNETGLDERGRAGGLLNSYVCTCTVGGSDDGSDDSAFFDGVKWMLHDLVLV